MVSRPLASSPLEAADPGDALGLDQLPAAGPQLLLGPALLLLGSALLGDVAGDRHPAGHRAVLVADGHDVDRPDMVPLTT
jgi:hypothetical protein